MRVLVIAIVALVASCFPVFAFEMIGQVVVASLLAIAPGLAPSLAGVSAVVIGAVILGRKRK